LDTADFEEQRDDILQRYSDIIEKETMKASSGNAFSRAVVSGARGNPAHVKAILSTPGIYTDSKGRIIPLFVRNSFSGGVRPAEMLAGTYGARLAVTCLKYDTLVRMVDGGVKRICDIVVGDWVVGADKSGKCFPVCVSDVFDQGIQPVHDVIFRPGNAKKHLVSVTCTMEHKFLFNDARAYNAAASRFKRGGAPPDPELAHTTSVYPVKEKRTRQSVVMASGCAAIGGIDEPFALLLGLMAGDGCYVNHQRNMRLSCADLTMVDDIRPYLADLGLKIEKGGGDNHDFLISTVDYTARTNTSIQPGQQGFVAGARLPFRQTVIDHDLAEYSYNKQIPQQIWGWSNKSLGDFLAGLLATDGCLYFEGRRKSPAISFYMTAESLIRELSEVLHVRLGVRPTTIHEVTKGGFGDSKSDRKHALYGFTVSALCDVAKILEAIGAVPGVKASLVETAKKFKLKQNNPYPKSRLLSSDFSGYEHCFDIEVDHPDHLFVLANGMITSNSTKRATAKGGDLLKLWNQNVSNYNVTATDCGTDNGLDFQSDDDSLSGRVLARAVGDVPAGSVIDRTVLSAIRKSGKPIIARSSMTCRAKHGICAKCAGVQADGRFAPIGESLGITAASAIGEPIVQGSLNTKHNAGMAKGKKTFSGLDTTIQFVQIPDEFKDRAAVAEEDGVVESINEAPQGGTYVTVNGRQHFVLPGFSASVKVGEKVEAGDIISDGLASPADIVRLRGLGEGRRYYADRLGQILHDSGNKPDKRHMELVARAVVDDYRIDDPGEDSPYLPDDSVRENEFLETYKPPADTAETLVDKSIGGYLQKPVLHYTVGTRVTPKIADRMRTAGVQQVLSSRETPWYTADMKRLRVASHDSKDWLVGLGTSYLSSQMRDSLERGDETNVQENYHYGPRLAYGGDAGKGAFGENVRETGMF
jgi:hypothetical protein